MGKSALVARPIAEAGTRHSMAASKISAPLVFFGRLLIPVYLRIALSFRKIEIRSPERLVKAVRDFQEKRTRLIVAFRHPYGDEPQLLFHVFENLIPRYARQLCIPLLRKSHIRLVHDYAVPLWGGPFIRFLLPRAGAMPVYHARSVPASLKNIRSALTDDPCPVGLAPEGQISYHSETLPRIEQGTIRMGFWCASDIEKAGRSERVLVLPLSVHYQYDLRDMKKIRSALVRLEALCGLAPVSGHTADTTPAGLLPRIKVIENRMLDITEAYYKTTYGYRPESMPEESEAAARQRRWGALLPFALNVAEHALGLDPREDDLVQRMYRVRLEGWDRICPESPVDRLTPLEAALAHRRTGEAWFAMRHMELVDLMSYHDVNYLEGGHTAASSFDRLVETVISLEDLAHRLMGGNITNRPNNIRKKAVLVPGLCLDLTASMPDYRRESKQTARQITEELAQKFKECIEVYRNEAK